MPTLKNTASSFRDTVLIIVLSNQNKQRRSSPEDIDSLHEMAVNGGFEKVTSVANLQEDGASRGAVAEPVRLYEVFMTVVGQAGA